MSSFTKPIKIEVLKEGRKYRLLEGFSYYRTNNENDVIKIPADFVTDGSSIPRLFWGIYPPTGGGTSSTQYFQPAILHDFLYETKKYSRKECDIIFKEAMKAVKVNWITRNLFYISVRLFGASHYGKK